MESLTSATFVGKGKTVSVHPLVIGKSNLPMLIDHKSYGKQVNGEVYEVDADDLRDLDRFEGHPDFNNRREIDILVSYGDKNVVEKCATYFITNYAPEMLQQRCYENYDSYADHGIPYDISENPNHPDNVQSSSQSS
ncbi:hypothetical protein DPMN_078235 [Dreissena polymorpha]|uniref:Gamma-glutamylcyclotransferase family protein n=2 Tax=Dreissena polymorpha TaxID=45954 RepID=A0A9D4BP00_DREPO|nr:hypothetical protein DPMN_078235 [Dreissena polymorpha]